MTSVGSNKMMCMCRTDSETMPPYFLVSKYWRLKNFKISYLLPKYGDCIHNTCNPVPKLIAW